MGAEKYNPYGGSQNVSDIFLCMDDVVMSDDKLATAIANADKLIRLQLTSENDVQYNDDGTVNIVPVNYQADKVLRTFFNTWVKIPSSGNLAEVVLDDGAKIGGGSSFKFVWVFYGGKVNDGTNDEIEVAVVKGKFSAKSGSVKTKRGEYNGYTIEFNGEVVTKVGGMALLPALFDTTLVDVISVTSELDAIAKDSSSIIKFVKAAA